VGKLFAVFSPQGGSGCTTLAVNLAVALQRNQHRPTALVDGNLHSADIGVHLNLSPIAKSVADIAGYVLSADADVVEQSLIRHSSGLNVLPGPATPDRGESVTVKGWRHVLELLLHTHDYVVVDTSPAYSEVTINTLDAADLILVPMPLELTSMKNARIFLQIADKFGYSREKVRLIANRFDRAEGIALADAETSLAKKFTGVITFDRRALVLALNRGVPVVMNDPKSQLSRDLAQLAATVSSLPTPAPEPRKEPESERGPASTPELVSPSGAPLIRVFIVDDIRETCTNLARLIGFENDMKVVGIAHDGAEALRLAPAARPDVVLMDVMMPMMDGITATEVLTNLPGWKAPVLVMSVQGGQDYQSRALAAGARGYLVKPFSAEEFIGFIRQLHKLENAVRVLH
jgi:MinD-like ATPase involved in chromosome partitioning or flagellar assembly/ActR/RegA family two-component response regulator